MRLDFTGKTKGKVTKVTGFTIKLGQKETRPAAQLRVMASVANSILDKFSPGLREFLFEKAKGSEKTQKQLEGVEVVSDLPNLREPGVKLGALHWEDEQTGCTFVVDRAIDPITIKDCKINKFKIAPKDGGSVQIFYTLTTGELDQETAGQLLLLNQTEILFELIAAQVHTTQRTIEEEPEVTAGGAPKGDSTNVKVDTPEQALAKAVKQDKAAAAPSKAPAANQGRVKRRA